ncbi:hypothetical protein Pla22_27080 [Rubripirellula amarantea]|uniref:Uncharacterized protein n=1 Tax=Rubripirellula amarantea TaxID=2527999 RepID=A0A5C5WVS0_9BACT|nr:YdjY domain-containing protein [Rubripirellula amarantea]TWT55054.1 hypothetical protein Pla22_27080 [Rubripirellula amarantea]
MNLRFSPVFQSQSIFAIAFFSTLVVISGCGQPAEVAQDEPSPTVDQAAEEVTATPTKRMLPKPQPVGSSVDSPDDGSSETSVDMPEESGDDAPSVSISDPLTDEEQKTPLDDYVGPDEIAAKAFGSPPNAIQMTKTNLWIDRKKGLVYADGYVAMNEGPLEMFACPQGTKEHESVVATIAKANEVHAALLAIDAQPGTPVAYHPDFVPATGQKIRVWVCYLDQDKKFQVTDARQWIRKVGTDDVMDVEWVFGGSSVWKDPRDGRNYYQADAGDLICVSNFTTAMMDVPVSSSADAGSLLYEPFTSRIPERGTPVRLVLEPIAVPSDDDAAKNSDKVADGDGDDSAGNSTSLQPPTEEVLGNQ